MKTRKETTLRFDASTFRERSSNDDDTKEYANEEFTSALARFFELNEAKLDEALYTIAFLVEEESESVGWLEESDVRYALSLDESEVLRSERLDIVEALEDVASRAKKFREKLEAKLEANDEIERFERAFLVVR